MHPPHVPLVAEAEAADVERPRHARPRRRLLGEGLHVRVLLVDLGVEGAHEGDRLEVLAAAVLVGQPVARLARVVAVEHRGDGVDPQRVGVVLVEPEHCRGDEEALRLVAAVVEDVAVPLGVEAEPRVGVLEEVRAVEVGEPVLVAGEVRRHPVEDDPEPALVQVVDHPHQVLGRAVPPRRREVTRRLVAPRAVERVLHHRQQLDVREAERERVIGERGAELAVGERAVVLFGHATPRAEVHFVDRDRCRERAACAACRHPLVVVPGVREVRDLGRGVGRQLRAKRERVGLVDAESLVSCRLDPVLVQLPGPDAGQKPFPDAGAPAARQRVRVLAPLGERTHDADALGVRRPDGEVRPGLAVHLARMRAELLVQAVVRALVEEMQVVVSEERR